jgi:hypothetical protein
MKNFRMFLKPMGLFLAVFMLIISGPCQSAMAVMNRAQNAREYLNSLLAREDVRNGLVSHGIDPVEAKNRLDSLTDEEATRVADQLQALPAGGDGFFTALLILVFIVFLVLLITDIAGYTDIFPFVK